MTLGDTTENFPFAGSIDAAKSFGADMSMAYLLFICESFNFSPFSMAAVCMMEQRQQKVLHYLLAYLELEQMCKSMLLIEIRLTLSII